MAVLLDFCIEALCTEGLMTRATLQRVYDRNMEPALSNN
jgi:hypothetical protein